MQMDNNRSETEFQEVSQSEAYTGFASVYDRFMDNIPYDAWFLYIQKLLQEYGIHKGVVLELACGTGTIACQLAEAGYDVIGLDISEEMLMVAREKCPDSVLLLQQDMCEMELYGTVDAMVCVCDGMNYILQEEKMQALFQHVSRYLSPEGVLIFDLKTRYFFREVIGNRTIAENRDDASFIWENTFDEETGINEYYLTIYQLEEEENDLFSRCDELHYQRAYEVEKIQELIKKAGLETQAVYQAFTKQAPKVDTERMYFVVKHLPDETKSRKNS